MSDATRRALAALPFRLDLASGGGHQAGPRITLVHGTPTLNTLYWTEDRSDDFCRKMAAHAGLRPGDLIAFGHTHRPWHREIDGVHFVNTGSVGRPKDGDPRAGYVLLHPGPDGMRVEFVRLDYDFARAGDGIRASDLPDAFATFLETGGSAP